MGQISSIYRIGSVYGSKKRTGADKKARKRKKMPYAEYLKTPYWQSVREAVFERECHVCHLCRKSGPLQVHHISYQYRGDELRHLETVTALCSSCHKHVHGK